MQTTIISHAARLLQLPVESIDLSSSFVNLGGHSLVALGLASACRKDGINLTMESILLSPSMSDLITSAVAESPVQTETETQTQTQPQSQPQTLSFLHSHQKSPGSNMINFFETYETAHLPIVKAA
ncbi:hypothetical protein SI65_05415 [Aspergillus cristatus]|uniref:Carrier domain-containing protein n=1 Tax=Aspergillus cristatus TaxID=573508 RepID=A0A1E3BD36_ASPCR|nr:hypothetical protein SI65_05415 [Aspergillus cristatus]